MASDLDQAKSFGGTRNQGFGPLSTAGALPPCFHPVFPFRYFNSIQAECFECLYHSSDSAVVRYTHNGSISSFVSGEGKWSRA